MSCCAQQNPHSISKSLCSSSRGTHNFYWFIFLCILMLFGEEERKRARVAIPNYAVHRCRALIVCCCGLRRRRAVMDIKVAATAEQHTYHMRIYTIYNTYRKYFWTCVRVFAIALFCTLAAASMLGRQMAYIGIRRCCRSVEVPLQTPHRRRRHRTNISKLFRKSYFP